VVAEDNSSRSLPPSDLHGRSAGTTPVPAGLGKNIRSVVARERSSHKQAPINPARSPKVHPMPQSADQNDTLWYDKGLRFDCTQCGLCCISGGEYAEVPVTTQEAARIASILKISNEEFATRYCLPSTPILLLKDGPGGRCILLTEDNRCSVYEARPAQCGTWPFWPENVTTRALWDTDVAERCPGVNAGPLYPLAEIRAFLKVHENDVVL